MAYIHQPVMVREAIESLRCRPGGVYVDGTVGGGGHAEEILRKTAPDGLLIGIDADDEAIEAAKRRLAPFGERKIIAKGNFADMDKILAPKNIDAVDGILLDLGVSSPQLDEADRGFSFLKDGPLDMRMDRTTGGPTAADLVNSAPWEELARIIRDYGEERMAARIAKAIVRVRALRPLRTTSALAEVVKQNVPPAKDGLHPATRTFQALRIAVNNELANLSRAVEVGIGLLKPQGRFSIISFHSLEDRIVKHAFRNASRGCLCPADLPVCTCGRKPLLRVVTPRPVTPSEEEMEQNPRARSAKLRTAERI